jgi:hypothetical protein
MNAWLKKAALAIILLVLLDFMVRLVWAALRPVAPFLVLIAVALYLLIRLFKRTDGW